MKKNILLIFLFISFINSHSQSLSTNVIYNRVSRPALMLELPYNQEVSEGFIVSNLKKTGYDPESKGKLFWKQNKINGFYTFKGVKLEGSDQMVDLYFRIDQKSRRIKDQSIIYLLVSKGNDNFITPDKDEDLYKLTQKLLNSFVSQSASYKLDMDVKAQEAEVKDAESKLEKQIDYEKELTKKIEQLQEDLKKNKMDQENQKLIIQNEKKKLTDLKSKVL
jgi:hypothetical protein